MTSISNLRSSELLAENRRLKAQLADMQASKPPITLDPKSGELQVDNLSLGSLTIEKLRVRAPGLREASADLKDVANWLPSKENEANFKKLAEKPVVVDELKARIPLPFVNSIMERIAGKQMQDAGLSEVRLSQGEGSQIRVNGRVKKGISLPFEINGDLVGTPDGKAKFSLRSSRVAGLPMPNFLVSFATKFAGESLEKAGIAVDGGEFSLDTQKMKPDKLLFELQSLSVQDGAILIEGAAPVRTGASSVPRVPRKS